MNFIILRIIFRKYLHISKILLFACTLFIIKNFDKNFDKNFEHNFSKFGGLGGPNCPHVVRYIIPI